MMMWLVLVVPAMLLAMLAQWWVHSACQSMHQVPARMSGAEAARTILDAHGLVDVVIEPSMGFMSDHYDPQSKVVRLSPEVYEGHTMSAVGIAAHEVGHAIQHGTQYAWLGLRMSLVGVTGFASYAAWFAIMGGMILSSVSPRSGLGRMLLLAGIVLFSATVFFQMITLPVEYDASRRAKAELLRLGLVTPDERVAVDKVLSAAALTYVAGMVSAMLELLRLVLIFRGGSRSDDD
jgi:Zn-dependent membrane protease YugP